MSSTLDLYDPAALAAAGALIPARDLPLPAHAGTGLSPCPRRGVGAGDFRLPVCPGYFSGRRA